MLRRRKFAIDSAQQKPKPLVQILRDSNGIVPDYMLEQPEVLKIVRQEYLRV